MQRRGVTVRIVGNPEVDESAFTPVETPDLVSLQGVVQLL